ncbi:uncharacterized protein TRIADDRAFT_54424 [Trichoplax adhaerens]|uniref:Uncharacterized protein n=1 Tax=Trichoplax adhaerens TaxID=10228 RepID=B3RRZ9_TRIAD|nr:hypothetical protein TRIADDRAFT_54424 [Trichoplax adhaerens]EDV26960.1 hypothetical protein TRIADDRAFT_54424 [Trichoplax adhaerens]|eukprot:XP_002110956.1 hypothetical protein TRIADDRAFT_54424 [Trichoplax adhaerens]
MTLEENEGNENVSRAASSKEIDLEAGKDNQDQTEVAVEKPKRKWFQKRKKEEEEEVVEKSVPYFQLVIKMTVLMLDFIYIKLKLLWYRASSDVQKEEEEEKEDLPPVSFLKIMRLNKDELGYIFIGTLGAIGQGSVMPVFAILFSEIIAVFAECDPVKRESDATFWSLMFLVLGSVSGISVFLQTLMYGISGEYMTKRLRSQTFRAILKQEIGWFDEQSHTTGALCNRLATDASEVKGATGTRLGAVIQSIVSMVAALVIAFVYGWKLALVILGCVPFIVVSGAIQMRVFIGGAKKNKDAADKAAEVSTEALENIRTVESLNLENKIIAAYTKNLKVMLRKSLIQAHVYGLAYGFSQAVIFFTYAAAFRFGAFLVANNQMNFADMFKVFSAIVFGALSLGQTSSFVPDYSKAKQSAARLFAILERESKINVENEGGERTNENDTTIKFENVNFNYPTRPTIPVLDGITFKVKPGQTIALVGTSGCGKSTSVALLERFYDTASGSVTVGGKEIRNINIKWLRSLMGIVQQEPILFNTTIAENISYGDNSRTLTRDDIITAAKSANIHDFIQGLPESYETLVGEKGTQMSGGQKQRIAIARALVRKPRILLLDEATSALDTESEKIVQAALDKAREGRTCIVIAHRLSTIRNADGIAVFQKGKIIEFGTHDELIAKEGVYFKLQNTQV